jgi:hypothetical protein
MPVRSSIRTGRSWASSCPAVGLGCTVGAERQQEDSGVRSEGRHARAVAQSLRFAQEAADRGDYREALSWLGAVEAADGALSPEWKQTRGLWQQQAGLT